MKHRFAVALLFLCFSTFGYSQFYHQEVHPTLQGQELLDALINDFKPNVVMSYNDARDVMYSEIDNVDDFVSGIYSDHTLFLDPNEPPRAFLFMNGDNDGINTEHSYPRSKGADNGNPESDLHHLYPTRTMVNSVRGSKPFAEIPDNQTDNWFYLTQNLSSIPSNNIDRYSENDLNTFEPREEVKGNIARSIMYFYTMYKSEADNEDPDYFELQRETLCDWHFADPVDSTENARTYNIASYQENKPNPFVLDCSVATRTYCSFIPAACINTVNTDDPLNKKPVILYPNPSQNTLNLNLGDVSDISIVKIYSTTGRLLLSKRYSNVQDISIQHGLDPSLYICAVIRDGITSYIPFTVN
jgi:hypothetical protein